MAAPLELSLHDQHWILTLHGDELQVARRVGGGADVVTDAKVALGSVPPEARTAIEAGDAHAAAVALASLLQVLSQQGG